MAAQIHAGMKLTGEDLDFLMAAAAPEVADRAGLRRLLAQDEDFRNAFVSDERTFRKLTAEGVFLNISPHLYFEVLLGKTRRVLEETSYTIERAGAQSVAVFDSNEVARFLSKQGVMPYLADMLASFTEIASYSIACRAKEGAWKQVTFNDLDIARLKQFSEAVEGAYRLAFFKRIADICLFVLGIFPDHAPFEARCPITGESRPELPWWAKRSTEDYEEEGRRFYEMAAEHPAAKSGKLSEVFGLLHDYFNAAKKPLNFLSENYLHYQRRGLFGPDSA